MGMAVRGLTPAQARDAGLGERGGALVTAVLAGSPAAALGLRSGDIIVSVGGQALGDASDLEERVKMLAPGAPAVLRVWRDGLVIELVLLRQAAAP